MADFSIWFNVLLYLFLNFSWFAQCTLYHTVYSFKKSGIYKINCKQSDKVYIGQTKRNVETRTKEHFRILRLNHIEKSALALPFWNTGQETDNSATLLKSVNKRNILLIYEKIFIYKHAHNIMNFEVLPESYLITKCVQTTR
jgi:GIY-YIG catalytic domain.